MSSGADRDFENTTGGIAIGIGKAGKEIFLGIYNGIKALKIRKNQMIAACSLLFPLAARCFHFYIFALKIPVFMQYLLYYAMFAAPILCIMMIGICAGKDRRNAKRIFEELDFKGKDGKYPYLCSIEEENKKVIYTFKSNIPIAEWQSRRQLLETGFDLNIVQLRNGKSKKIIKLYTIPSDYAIPLKVEWSDEYLQKKSGVIVVGVGAIDQIIFELDKVPHVLIAGETGSGKSVILRTCLWQMISQGSRIYMIDFKGGVEFGKKYEKYGEVITERERALQVLNGLVKENAARLKLFRDLEVKNLGEYNRKYQKKLCRIGVFCDEIAEMLDKKGVAKEEREIFEQIEGRISTLARLSRATGINLFLGVQRPDANVLTGQIKNNIPVRISGRFADKSASEIVLGNTAAVELPDIKGRFLYKVGNETIEFQSYYFDDDRMLKDIDAAVGGMLTESGARKKKSAPARKVVSYRTPNKSISLNSLSGAQEIKAGSIKKETVGSETDIEKRMKEIDEYDLNLMF